MAMKLIKLLLHIINITICFLVSLGHTSQFTSKASTALQSSSISSYGTQQLQRTTTSILSLGTSTTALREMTTSKLSSQDSSITSSSTEDSTWSSQQSSSRVSEIRLCATTSGNQSSSTVSGLTSTSPLPWWHWRCLYGWSTHTTNHPVSTMQITISSVQQDSTFTKYGSRQLTTAGTLSQNCSDSTGLCQNLNSSIAPSVTPLPAVNITAYTVVTNCWLWWWCVTTPTTIHPDSVTTMMTSATLSSNANTSVSNVIGRCEYPLWCEESQLSEICSSVGMNATFEVVICNAN